MIIVQKYNKKLLNQWDNFINLSYNGTVFQKQRFLSYHQYRKFRDCSLIIKYKEQIVALLPAAEIIENRERCFYSHPGSSYGGIVTKKNVAFKLMNEIIIALEQYLKKNRFNTIFLINSSKIYCTNQNDSLEYLLSWNKYSKKEEYISHAVELKNASSISNLLSKRKYRYLQNNKQLKKIEFQKLDVNKNLEQIKIFYDILYISKQLYNVKPTHNFEEIIKLLNLFPNEIELYVALNRGKIIGGYMIIHANKKTSLIFYNVVLNKSKYKQVAMLQLYHSMKLAKQHGQHFVDFGVSHIPEGKNPLAPKFSLIQFKEQLGAVGVQRTAYYKEL